MGTKDLFGNPTVQVHFETGEIIPYQVKARAKDADGPEVEDLNIHGLPIVIETRKGETRGGVTPGGESWSTVMPADYGFIKGVQGADGDSLDCYVGPEFNGWAYVVDQASLDGKKYDEAKVMLNFPSATRALSTYKAGHHRWQDIMLDWTPMPIDEFNEWLKNGDLTKPCSSAVKLRR
jgi:hypothetical protein